MMSYPKKVQSILKKTGVVEGDEVKIRSGEKTYLGVLMPHHSFSSGDIITIKLSNGYNIGLKVTSDMVVEKVKGRMTKRRTLPPPVTSSGKPTVSFLGTGGTIASYVDYRTGAVHPALTAEELAFSVPELQDFCNVRARVLFSIFSEDMKVRYWRRLAREIGREFKEGSKGVIIPHGTDTLGFASAALSFMLRDLPGPVILVGAQRSSDRPSSDAYVNLLSASRLVSEDLGEVVVLMHERTSDLYCTVHRGTKVRKMHSSRRDAFKTINDTPLGRVDFADGVTLVDDRLRRSDGPLRVDSKMEEDVGLLYAYPNMKPAEFEACAARNKGIVIAGTGLGHVAEDLLNPIRKATKGGVHVVMTSQSLYGRVGLYVYSRGRELLEAGVIPGEDMLPETALVKLMWVLGHTQEPNEVREMMKRNLVGEINPRIELEDYESGE